MDSEGGVLDSYSELNSQTPFQKYWPWSICACCAFCSTLIVIIILAAASGDINLPGSSVPPYGCGSAPDDVLDRRSDTRYFKVATFNVQWLFWQTSGGFCPGDRWPCPWPSQEAAQEHLLKIAEVIRDVNADFINLVSVQNCDVLQILQKELDNLGYLYYLTEGTDQYKRNIGFLTRIDPQTNLLRVPIERSYPIANSRCGYTGPAKATGVPNNYVINMGLKTPGESFKLSIVGMELAPNPLEAEDCSMREAQALIEQSFIEAEIRNGQEVIVLGDMNDYDPSIRDANDNVPTSSVLTILKANNQLTNVAEKIADQQKRYSAWNYGNATCHDGAPIKTSLIDHILISNNLLKYIKDVYIYQNYPDSCGSFYSYHWPVVVEFDFSL